MSGMWQSLARYQKFADRRGFGCEWSRMMAERTAEAAHVAARAAACSDASWPAKDAASVLAFILDDEQQKRGGSWKSYARWFVQHQAGRAIREERAEVL